LPTVALPAADPTVAFTVVYDDEHVIVVDKPAGLVVHPGAGKPDGTLVNGLLARYPELAEVGEAHRPGIVHRLDIGTSGLMVVARSIRAYHALVFALGQRDVARVYRTLVWGHLANPNGVIDAPIGRDHRDPMRMGVVVDGKSARTRYAVLRPTRHRRPPVPWSAASRPAALIRSGSTCRPSAIPSSATARTAASAMASPHRGRFLHAAEIASSIRRRTEQLSFTSQLPADLRDVEAQLTT
jgi:23S rRNA pseudouridine1911/1915/1917 synthase